MTKRQRLWQKRRKNKAADKRFLVVRNHFSPWEQRTVPPRLLGEPTPSPWREGSPACLPQPACWCSRTRRSLGWVGIRGRMKSVENGNLRSTEATLIFFSSSYALKKKKKRKEKHRAEQGRSCHSLPATSAWKNCCEQCINHRYSTNITLRVNTANFINWQLKGHWGKTDQWVVC